MNARAGPRDPPKAWAADEAGDWCVAASVCGLDSCEFVGPYGPPIRKFSPACVEPIFNCAAR